MTFAQNNSEESRLENLKIPTEVNHLLDNFSMIEYNVKAVQNGEITLNNDIRYQHLGQEMVNDTEVDKVSLKLSKNTNKEIPSELYFWFEENEVIQMEVEGEVLSDEMAKVMGDQILGSIFAPFQNLSNFNIQEYKKLGKVTEGKETFNGKELDVVTVEVQNIPEYNLDSGRAKIAKLEKISVVMEYKYISSKDNIEVEFKVNDFKLF